MSITEAFEDRYYSHAINLMQEEKRLRRKMLGFLKEMEKDILSQMDDAGMSVRLATGTERESRLNSMLSQVRGSIDTAYDNLNANSSDYLTDFGMRDSQNQVDLANAVLEAPLFSTQFTPLQARKVLDTTIVRGALQSNWWEKQSANTKQRITSQINLGYMEGETVDQIKRRLIGKSTGKYQIIEVNGRPRRVYERQGGIISVSVREAEALARTSIQAISNRVRDEVFAENEDVISEVESVATFDSRTTPLCASYNGLRWTQKGHKPVNHKKKYLPTPRHWNCRSTHIPVLPDLEELDRLASDRGMEIPQSVRATIDGPQPEMIPMDDWLKSKPFGFQEKIMGGAGKVRLFRDGKISLRDLTDDQGQVLSLGQIQSMLDLPPPPKPKPAILKNVGKLNILEGQKVIRLSPSERFQAIGNRQDIRIAERQKKEALDQYMENEDNPDFRVREAYWDKYQKAKDRAEETRKLIRELGYKELILPAEAKAKDTQSLFVLGSLRKSGLRLSTHKKVKDAETFLKNIIRKDRLPKVTVRKAPPGENRAYYQSRNQSINITDKDSGSTIVHEIAHDLEYRYPWISKKSKAFLKKRAKGERPKQLRVLTGNNGYDSDEKAYEDDWVKKGGSHYMGKIYPRASTELISMGAERLLANPVRFAQEDPEYFDFIMEIFQGV